MTTRAFVAGPASWNTLVRLERLPESRPHMVRAQGHHQALGGTSAGKALQPRRPRLRRHPAHPGRHR